MKKSKIVRIIFSFILILAIISSMDNVKADNDVVDFEDFCEEMIENIRNDSYFTDVKESSYVYFSKAYLRSTPNCTVSIAKNGNKPQDRQIYRGEFKYHKKTKIIDFYLWDHGNDKELQKNVTLKILEYSLKEVIRQQNLNMNDFEDYRNLLLESKSSYTLEKDGITLFENIEPETVCFKIDGQNGLKTYPKGVLAPPTPSVAPTPSTIPTEESTVVENPNETSEPVVTPTASPVPTESTQSIESSEPKETPMNTKPSPKDITQGVNPVFYYIGVAILIIAVLSVITYFCFFKNSKNNH